MSMPLWKRHSNIQDKNEAVSDEKHKLIDFEAFKIRGVKYALISFAAYCSAELSVGLWGSSFLIGAKGVSAETAAYLIALYYGSITAGRLISGFISFKVSNKIMIRTGALLAAFGVILMIVPLAARLSWIPFVLTGLGLSPIFPAMIHETPRRFGKEKSQTIIGYQMAFAYTGNAIFPPLFGLIIANTAISIMPYLLLMCSAVLIFSAERIDKVIRK